MSRSRHSKVAIDRLSSATDDQGELLGHLMLVASKVAKKKVMTTFG